MEKIEIVDNKFMCPMMEEEISERGKITFGTCAKCKFNTIHQFIDDNVYCEYNG